MNICIFGASSNRLDDAYFMDAGLLGKKMPLPDTPLSSAAAPTG